MSIQPASGARDLNPQQVEINHLLTSKLSKIYRQWGYEEIAPPRIERLETLTAGGRIESKEIVKIVSDEQLGLLPEMTASIARAAGTRFGKRPKPLRLWSSGTIFRSKQSIEGGVLIEENLQSGVELFGVTGISAEMELLSLMLESLDNLKLEKVNNPTLLIGHTSLMELILSKIDPTNIEAVSEALSTQNMIKFGDIDLDKKDIKFLKTILNCKGDPDYVLKELKRYFPNNLNLSNLERLFKSIGPIASKHNIRILLDPTFQPHFKLYNGIVFQMVCKTPNSLVVIARGGRYDELVKTFSLRSQISAGVGFSFAIDQIREILPSSYLKSKDLNKVLIAYSQANNLEKALEKQSQWHKKGSIALVELESCENEDQAHSLINERGCNQLDWLG